MILKNRLKWGKDDPIDSIKPIISKRDFLRLQQVVENQVYIDEAILDYIAAIIEAIRNDPRVEAGPSPRGALALMKLSKAYALIRGKDYVSPDDVKVFIIPALAHRIIIGTEYLLEDVKPEDVIKEAVSKVPVPKGFEKAQT